MRAIRNTVEKGAIGVFESPTGTGKSQMLLNGVLSTVFPARSSEKGDLKQEVATNRHGLEKRIRAIAARRPRRNTRKNVRTPLAHDDPDFIHQSDSDQQPHGRRCRRESSSSSSSDQSTDSDDVDDPRCLPLAHPKVYFCSRTHSQLSQLAEEFRKTVFSHQASAQSGAARSNGDNRYPTLPFVHLASRAQLCIHSYLRAGGGPSSAKSLRLNDMCKEALKNNSTKDGRLSIKEFWRKRGGNGGGSASSVGLADLEDLIKTASSNSPTASSPGAGGGACLLCPFAQPSRLKVLKDYARASSRTLEELVVLGTAVGACPFLASKDLVREANVVLLPYSYVVDPVARGQLLPDDMFAEDDGGEDESYATAGGAGQHNHGSAVGGAGQQLPAFRGNVVVFDEAHHVADTARHNLSHTVPLLDLELAASLIDTYGVRFEGRLLAKNKSKLRELASVCRKMLQFGQRCCVPNTDRLPSVTPQTLLPLSDLLFEAGIDHVNPIHLSNFFDDTKLVFKLPSQAVHAAIAAAATPSQQATSSSGGWTAAAGDLSPFLAAAAVATNARKKVGSIHEDVNETVAAMGSKLRARLTDAAQRASFSVLKMLQVLSTIPVGDCVVRVGVTPKSPEDGGGAAAFQLIALRGACTMQRVFESAASVLFAGGTMQPLAMLVDSLMPDAEEADGVGAATAPLPGAAPRYGAFSFPHVIPPSSLRVVTLHCGPSGKPLEFTFAQRSQLAEQMEDAARCVVNLARVIPHGLIVCFTSYAMEDVFFQRAAATGILDQLNSVKRVFREQRASIGSGSGGSGGGGNNEESILDAYRRWIEQGLPRASSSSAATAEGINHGGRGGGGAMLSCVMGGKLSEGINFNDHLGRGVIVIGLPYPNPNDVEMKLLLNATTIDNGSRSASRARDAIALTEHDSATSSAAARLLYQQICMRSVNQAMGRCIRHINDYAVVVLLDGRYRRPEVSAHVAGWMQPSMTHALNFGECFRSVREFFEARQS
jgi:chromosome transmission fidelity protein 1